MTNPVLQVREFPSLLLGMNGKYHWIMRGYAPVDQVQAGLDTLLAD